MMHAKVLSRHCATHISSSGCNRGVKVCPNLMRRVRKLEILCPRVRFRIGHFESIEAAADHVAWARMTISMTQNYEVEVLHVFDLALECPKLTANLLETTRSFHVRLKSWDEATVVMDALKKCQSPAPQHRLLSRRSSIPPTTSNHA